MFGPLDTEDWSLHKFKICGKIADANKQVGVRAGL